MDQEQPTPAGSIESRRQGCCAGLLWEAATLILNLPDHPIGREDAANTELPVSYTHLTLPTNDLV